MPTNQEWSDERCIELYLSQPIGTKEWTAADCCTEIPCKHGLGALVRAAVAEARREWLREQEQAKVEDRSGGKPDA